MSVKRPAYSISWSIHLHFGDKSTHYSHPPRGIIVKYEPGYKEMYPNSLIAPVRCFKLFCVLRITYETSAVPLVGISAQVPCYWQAKMDKLPYVLRIINFSGLICFLKHFFLRERRLYRIVLTSRKERHLMGIRKKYHLEKRINLPKMVIKDSILSTCCSF